MTKIQLKLKWHLSQKTMTKTKSKFDVNTACKNSTRILITVKVQDT